MTVARAVRLVLATAAVFASAFTVTGGAVAAPLAETRNVEVRGNAFSPLTITVGVGDLVRWTNLDNVAHSVVSLEANFVSNNFVFGQSETLVMTRPGTWDYVCGIHGLSMRGTIVVVGVAPPATPTPAGPQGRVIQEVGLYTPLATKGAAGAGDDRGQPLLWASLGLAAAVLTRLGWLLAHR